MSEFYFRKGTLIQNLIHAFKYKGNKDMGKYLGRMMGESLLHCGRFQNIDLIIPLPLFAAKEHKRGFNQAAILCAGLSAKLKSNFANDCVIRKQFTETQTKKHRTERWQNVSGSFETINDQNLEGKHILLVDDVITTGATLEACGNEILKVEGTKISVATLAFASK